jgi:hypothetical protein
MLFLCSECKLLRSSLHSGLDPKPQTQPGVLPETAFPPSSPGSVCFRRRRRRRRRRQGQKIPLELKKWQRKNEAKKLKG